MESIPPMQCSPQRGAAAASAQATVTVGYAFMAKKTASMHRVLSGAAAGEPGRGAEAGDAREAQERVVFEPFAFDEDSKKELQVILHKLSEDIMFQEEKAESRARMQHLRDYLAKHPNTLVIDPIESVERVISRASSCAILSNLRTTHPDAPFRGPRWFLAESVDEAKRQLGPSGSFSYPVICKPVAACGIPESHLMTVVVDEDGLALASMPCVVQEYTNHGGLLHKVYMLGDDVMVYHRKSLPDLPRDAIQSLCFDSQQTYPTLADFMPAGRADSTDKTVSKDDKRTRSTDNGGACSALPNGIDKQAEAENGETEGSPTKATVTPRDSRTLPMEVYMTAAAIMRQVFGLSLLGFDIIVCQDTGDIVVIDVNYFPSYKEVEDFPIRLKRFILQKYKQATSSES